MSLHAAVPAQAKINPSCAAAFNAFARVNSYEAATTVRDGSVTTTDIQKPASIHTIGKGKKRARTPDVSKFRDEAFEMDDDERCELYERNVAKLGVCELLG